ncbi:MAG: galactose ABC transporter substrate-binding protein [Dorea sp.]|nr:galactose ABC transporter substrate-binding protein [Dorea sp.]
MKGQWKKCYRMICGCLLLCLLAGCASQQNTKKKDLLIGVVLYDEYDTFISQLMDSFMEAVSQKTMNGKNISVLRYDSAGSQITQNEQVEELIDKGCDVLCVNLVDRTDPSMIIETAQKADVPVIFFNRELVEKDLQSWERLYYVGADAFISGTIEGEIAADAWFASEESMKPMDKNGDHILQYIILEGEAGHQDAIVRTEYSVNALTDAGIQVERLDSVIANWNRAQAQTKMGQLYNKYQDQIELIMCNNDDMALGVIDEYDLLQIPQEQRPALVGIDGTDVGLEAVLSGNMIGTVYNDKEGQARSILELAIAAATGEGMNAIDLFDGKYIRYPYERITIENISDYMTVEGEEADGL